jgi:ribosomal protein S18 acetylase RimI-like enzyme
MSLAIIEYKTDTASVNDVFLHLSSCNENFEPSLDKKVNIEEYSKKIAQLSTTFEAWAENNLIGLVGAYFNDEQNRKGYITNVSTLKEYLGKGIASNLVNNCVEYANRNGFSEISLEVNADNRRAIKLYEKFNFIQVGANSENIIMKWNLK